MPCYSPLRAYMSAPRANGKREISFRPGVGTAVDLPCGQCIGCRLERSRQWATRIMHEASLYDHNCFLTLTYDDEHLPSDCGLRKRDVQLFLKRLRKSGKNVRYFSCGEYGSLGQRPHYHMCLFGYDFPDRVFFSSRGGNLLYVSHELSTLWPFGFSTVGSLVFESAAYVARYCLKKVTGPSAKSAYERVDARTGEVADVSPEFVLMSLKPGIGSGWFERYSADVYPSDEVIVRGHSCKPPRYYDKSLEKQSLDLYERVKRARVAGSLDPDSLLENDSIRMKVKAEVKAASIRSLKRSL